MTGSLHTSHYDVVKEEHESEQSQLSTFFEDDSSPTTIAVVRLPRETKIDEYCDEWMPELGMPERDLKRFWSYRSGFKTNSAVDNPTERAFEDARLDYHYRRYLRASDEAQAALAEITRRLENGEAITLVCFEEPHQPCHRHIIADFLEARLSSNYDFSSEKRDEPLTA